MRRCLELASLGAGHTAPNPMVGAVLVYEDGSTGEERIIGEGYHMQYGQAHAEPNCIASVKEEDRRLIADSTLYVSLEPCAHHGKTPPCADLIIEKKIPRVVIGCRDPYPQVNGKGIEKLLSAGVSVTTGVLEAESILLNKRFFTFNTLHRPYITLKWAQSADGKIAGPVGEGLAGAGQGALAEQGEMAEQRTLISNEYTNRLVHKWRSEEAAILVGTRTALIDDPALTVRLWNGPNPIRLVIDMELKLPETLKLFDRKARTIVFNRVRHGGGDRVDGGGDRGHGVGVNEGHGEEGNVLYFQLEENEGVVGGVIRALHRLKIQSVLVEGGARLLQSFIDEDCWDEARVITNNELEIPGGLAAPVFGLAAPVLKEVRLLSKENLLSDTIRIYDRTGFLLHD
jgi:diaminohydroxyphosphoribosylaminopyrimidine deaminase / 5-amino-6-(5-phosphoribosylamino)uracil reductase